MQENIKTNAFHFYIESQLVIRKFRLVQDIRYYCKEFQLLQCEAISSEQFVSLQLINYNFRHALSKKIIFC